MDIKKFEDFRNNIKTNVGQVVVGKGNVLDKVIVSFICGGHVLLGDVPGLGKTKMARAFAKSINCEFKRIQFTPT